jgi:PTH1 family peptidyl-tRNA hydrolase
MTQAISLIAGLGNPGPEYAETRHNAGFRFLDLLRAGHGASLRLEPRFRGHVARVSIAGREVWLLAPDTYMNHSGESVAKLARFYKIPAGEVLVAHDELDLPPGAVRLKVGGGDGGHNGLKDITAQLGGGDYARLRLGIGRPATSAQVTSFVLRRAPAAEQALLDDAIRATLTHLDDIVRGQFQKVMNALHVKPS